MLLGLQLGGLGLQQGEQRRDLLLLGTFLGLQLLGCLSAAPVVDCVVLGIVLVVPGVPVVLGVPDVLGHDEFFVGLREECVPDVAWGAS